MSLAARRGGGSGNRSGSGSGRDESRLLASSNTSTTLASSSASFQQQMMSSMNIGKLSLSSGIGKRGARRARKPVAATTTAATAAASRGGDGTTTNRTRRTTDGTPLTSSSSSSAARGRRRQPRMTAREIIAAEQEAARAEAARTARPKLTEAEWNAAAAACQIRNDSALPCPICHEEFKLDDQVMLSCTHVFHRVCLRNFERFSNTRCCPICRAQEYEKRRISDGAVLYRHRCATRVQSLWRGYVARKAYAALKEATPPTDPQEREEWNYRKLQRTTVKMASLMTAKDDLIDSLFAELDVSVAKSRSTLAAADHRFRTVSDDEWARIRNAADARECDECPVCMMDMSSTCGKPRVLLSCTHVFHDSCLASFERFSHKPAGVALVDGFVSGSFGSDGGGGNIGCPICREPYQKREY